MQKHISNLLVEMFKTDIPETWETRIYIWSVFYLFIFYDISIFPVYTIYLISIK